MAKTNTEPKAEKVTRITRAQAANNVVAAMTGNTTLSELAKAADAAFVTAGGKSRVKAATAHVRRALETAESLGVLRLTKPTDLLVERIKR